MFNSSIILIGMPGSGKTTIGKTVASMCGIGFVDTDELLQKELGMTLQEYIDKFGTDRFAGEEEKFLCSLERPQTPQVIATGGSAILYPDAVKHLKTIGTLVFIDCDLPQLKKRIWNFESRGIVLAAGQNREQALLDLYSEREPMYYKYCDVRIEQGNRGRKSIANSVIKGVEEYEAGTRI